MRKVIVALLLMVTLIGISAQADEKAGAGRSAGQDAPDTFDWADMWRNVQQSAQDALNEAGRAWESAKPDVESALNRGKQSLDEGLGEARRQIETWWTNDAPALWEDARAAASEGLEKVGKEIGELWRDITRRVQAGLNG